MEVDEKPDEGIVAVDEFELVAGEYNEDIPASVASMLFEFGRHCSRLQFEAAAQCMNKSAESSARVGAISSRSTDSTASLHALTPQTCWKDIILALSQMASAEAVYIQMPFLFSAHSLPQRKEAEMKRHFHHASEGLRILAAHLPEGTLPRHICQQGLAYIAARGDLIKCHKRIVDFNESSEDSLQSIEDSLESVGELAAQFHHPVLSELANNFGLESDLLKCLVATQKTLNAMNMMDATVRLKELKERLRFWVRQIEWGTKKKNQLFAWTKKVERWNECRLVAYLCSYHAWLLLRFTAQFYETLHPYANALEAERLLTEGEESMDGLSISDLSRPLRRKEKEAMVAILLDRRREKSPWKGLDYRHPGSGAEYREGTASSSAGSAANQLLAVFISAADRTEYTNRSSSISEWLVASELEEGHRLFSLITERDGRLTSVFAEPIPNSALVMVIVVPSKKTEKDPVISKFMSSVVSTLRGATLAARWRTC